MSPKITKEIMKLLATEGAIYNERIYPSKLKLIQKCIIEWFDVRICIKRMHCINRKKNMFTFPDNMLGGV